jgi:hypothetical protein
MKDPLRVGKAIRAQLEQEIPKDSPYLLDFREGTDRTITEECVSLITCFPNLYNDKNLTGLLGLPTNSALPSVGGCFSTLSPGTYTRSRGR